MKYDISKAIESAIQNLEKRTKNIKLSLIFASKTCKNPQFRGLFLYFAQKTASQNFSIRTSIGRCFVAKGLY